MTSFTVEPSKTGKGYNAITDAGRNKWTHNLILFHGETFMEATIKMLEWFSERNIITKKNDKNCTDQTCQKEHAFIYYMGIDSGTSKTERHHLTEEELKERAKRERELKDFNEEYDTMTAQEMDIHDELNNLIDEFDIAYFPHEDRINLIKWAKKIAQI